MNPRLALLSVLTLLSCDPWNKAFEDWCSNSSNCYDAGGGGGAGDGGGGTGGGGGGSAITGELSFDTMQADFGVVFNPNGSVRYKSAYVRNASSRRFVFSIDAGPELTANLFNCPAEVDSGSCQVSLEWRPTRSMRLRDVVVASSTVPDDPRVMSFGVSGRAVTVALEVSPTSWPTDAGSEPFTVRNRGDDDLDGVSIELRDAGPFYLGASRCNTPLPPDAGCTFDLGWTGAGGAGELALTAKVGDAGAPPVSVTIQAP